MEKQREKEEMGKNENVTVLCLQKVVMSFTNVCVNGFGFPGGGKGSANAMWTYGNLFFSF